MAQCVSTLFLSGYSSDSLDPSLTQTGFSASDLNTKAEDMVDFSEMKLNQVRPDETHPRFSFFLHEI